MIVDAIAAISSCLKLTRRAPATGAALFSLRPFIELNLGYMYTKLTVADLHATEVVSSQSLSGHSCAGR